MCFETSKFMNWMCVEYCFFTNPVTWVCCKFPLESSINHLKHCAEWLTKLLALLRALLASQQCVSFLFYIALVAIVKKEYVDSM